MTHDATTAHGVVVRGTGGTYQVLLDDNGGEVEASMRGRLKRVAEKPALRNENKVEDAPLKLAVGDYVTLTRDDPQSAWVIADIKPRHGKLARRAPGGARGERVIIANVDQVLVVFATARPEPHPKMLDRFLIIAEANDLPARIVINKEDLAPGVDIRAQWSDYERAGYPLHVTSVKDHRGLDELKPELVGRTTALTGPSGVGKSSLMNALFPGLDLRTAEISDSVNKGRHTTVGAFLHPLPGGGFLADTPGLREVGLWGITADSVDHCFPEYRPLIGTCRFQDCTHIVEPGCAIREAVESGAVSRSRYESYVKLRGELTNAEQTEWS